MGSKSESQAEYESSWIPEQEANKPALGVPQSEMDAFFASIAEENRKRLVELVKKYNFDFVNGVPEPGGRYEWDKIESKAWELINDYGRGGGS